MYLKTSTLQHYQQAGSVNNGNQDFYEISR